MDLKTLTITFGLASLPLLQVMPNLEFLQGLEKVGIIGFLSAVVIFLVWERRFFMTKTTGQITTLESRMVGLETNVSSGDERIVGLLNAQLETLREIKDGQNENFSRMWELAVPSRKPSADNDPPCRCHGSVTKEVNSNE